jgi:tetratricopeptide (TPR) repeat protein
MENDEKTELLQRYYDGTISGAELSKVEILLKEEPELVAELQQIRNVEMALHGLGVGHLRDEMTQWEKEMNLEKTKGRTIPLYFMLSIAAVGLLLIVAGIFLFFPENASNQQLYTSYFTPYEDMISVRGDEETVLLNEAMSAYNEGNYEAATPRLQRYAALTDARPEIHLYLGISLMQTNQDAAALESLKISLDQPLVQQQAEWYIALAYLKQDDMDRARQQLEEIANNSGHYKQESARNLLESLS